MKKNFMTSGVRKLSKNKLQMKKNKKEEEDTLVLKVIIVTNFKRQGTLGINQNFVNKNKLFYNKKSKQTQKLIWITIK